MRAHQENGDADPSKAVCCLIGFWRCSRPPSNYSSAAVAGTGPLAAGRADGVGAVVGPCAWGLAVIGIASSHTLSDSHRLPMPSRAGGMLVEVLNGLLTCVLADPLWCWGKWGVKRRR